MEISNTSIDEKKIMIDGKAPAKLVIQEIDGDSLNDNSYEMLKKSDVIFMVCDINSVHLKVLLKNIVLFVNKKEKKVQ